MQASEPRGLIRAIRNVCVLPSSNNLGKYHNLANGPFGLCLLEVFK